MADSFGVLDLSPTQSFRTLTLQVTHEMLEKVIRASVFLDCNPLSRPYKSSGVSAGASFINVYVMSKWRLNRSSEAYNTCLDPP